MSCRKPHKVLRGLHGSCCAFGRSRTRSDAIVSCVKIHLSLAFPISSLALPPRAHMAILCPKRHELRLLSTRSGGAV